MVLWGIEVNEVEEKYKDKTKIEYAEKLEGLKSKGRKLRRALNRERRDKVDEKKHRSEFYEEKLKRVRWFIDSLPGYKDYEEDAEELKKEAREYDQLFDELIEQIDKYLAYLSRYEELLQEYSGRIYVA